MPLIELPTLTTSAELVLLGDAPARLGRGVRDGSVTRLRRGVYVNGDEWRAQKVREQHLLRIAAAQANARHPLVFSHESAAAIWGVPIAGPWLASSPCVTGMAGGGRRSRYEMIWHTTDLRDVDIVERNGFLVTAPLRTAIDLISSRSLMSGAVSLDHILREQSTFGITSECVRQRISDSRPFRGVRRADAAVDTATGLSSSPVESISLVRFREFHLPFPDQQTRFVGLDGRVYFTDFAWPHIRLIGETDGRIKYEDPAYLNGRTPEQALWDEKQREDELRAQSDGFLRWTWQDAWRGAPLLRKLERAGPRPS